MQFFYSNSISTTAVIIIVGIAWACSATELPADDWPQWGRSAQRNTVSSETGLPHWFSPGKRIRRHGKITYDLTTAQNVKWVSQLGGATYGSPVVAGGRVYIGTNDGILQDDRFEQTDGGVLRCLSEDTGQLIWQLVVPRLHARRASGREDMAADVSKDFDAMGLGISSTPTVEGDRLYVVTNRCEVLCLDVHGQADGNDGPFVNESVFSSGGQMVKLRPTDGDIIWRFDMLRDIPNFPHDAANCSVLVHGRFLYVCTSNGVSYGKVVRPEAPSIIVLDKITGQLVGRDDTMITPSVLHGQWSSPSLGMIQGQAVILHGGGDGWCYAFQPLDSSATAPAFLTERWRFDANPARYRQLCPTTEDYWDFARRGRKNRAADAARGSVSEIIGTPILHQKRVYVGIGQDPTHGPGAGALSCYDATLGGDVTRSGLLWQYTDIGRTMATAVIHNGLVYIAETSGRIHCLDADDGSLQWAADPGHDVWGSTLVADGKVYVGTKRGLAVFRAGRTGGQLLGKIRLSTRVPASPIVANGVLYVASRRNLFAVQDLGGTAPAEAQP